MPSPDEGVAPVSTNFGIDSSAVAGCSSDTPQAPDEGPATDQLIVSASSQAPPLSIAPATQPAAVPIGDPASMLIGLYSFHISTNADCSGPFLTAFDNGGSALVKDFTTNPELFRAGDVPIGTYPCVAMRISDILEFQSGVSSGACVAGVLYGGDIYRAGAESEPFLDLDLRVIPATGTDTAPSDDRVFVFFSTNPTAATARGLAVNQVLSLSSPLVVPDAVTFYWNATNAVMDKDGRCILEPDAPSLFS